MIAFSLTAFASQLPDAPVPQRLVVDMASLLSDRQVSALERKLVAFSDTTSTQIVVVTTTSLEDYTISEYATELAHKWGVGVKGKDNGVMIVVKPKTRFSKGEVYIAVGYGLEGALPDITAGRIVQQVMIPKFSENKIYAGIDEAVDTIMSITSGEYSADEWSTEQDNIKLYTYILIAVIAILVFIFSSRSKRDGDGSGGDTLTSGGYIGGIPFFGVGHHRSGGSSGGFGGGGFGGFGGGGFGGGGAGGSW